MSMLNNPNILSLMLIICAVLVIVSGCGRTDSATTGVNASHTTQSTAAPGSATGNSQDGLSASTQDTPAKSVVEYIASSSLHEAVMQSDVILIGTVLGKGGIFNSALDPEDPSKPSRSSYAVAQIYHIQVKRYLKGNGSDTINVAQTEGDILNPSNPIKNEEIKRALAASDAIPLSSGVTYLLFVQDRTKYYDSNFAIETPIYGPTKEPWRFVLAPDGSATIEAPQEAIRAIPDGFFPNPEAPLLPQIEQIVREQRADPPKP